MSEPVDAADDAASLNAALRGAFGGDGGSLAAPLVAELKPPAFVVIWPVYLEASATVANGRRVPRSIAAGCDNINVLDIYEAAIELGFIPGQTLYVEQKKLYPRAGFPMTHMNPGRVRVALKAGPGGAPSVKGIETKEALLRAAARMIPTLESRRLRQAQTMAKHEEAMRQQQAAREAQGLPPLLLGNNESGGGGGVGGAAKKKGKK